MWSSSHRPQARSCACGDKRHTQAAAPRLEAWDAGSAGHGLASRIIFRHFNAGILACHGRTRRHTGSGEAPEMKLYGLIACMLCVLFGACASQPKAPPRIMMQGFSLAPPNEKDWIVAKKSPDLTVIGKPGRYSGETFTMQATIVKLPAFSSADELVRHVESTQRKQLDPKRFRVFKVGASHQNIHGQACALSLVEAADRTATDGTGSTGNLMMVT